MLHANAEAFREVLIDAMSEAVTQDSISRGSTGGGVDVGKPYLMPSFIDPTEYARKTLMFEWAEQLSNYLGFPVVFREDGNYAHAEFGDPDAPEMVMALSHLDSPTSSISSSNLPRWTTSP